MIWCNNQKLFELLLCENLLKVIHLLKESYVACDRLKGVDQKQRCSEMPGTDWGKFN